MTNRLRKKMDAVKRIEGNESMSNTEVAQKLLLSPLTEFAVICLADAHDPRILVDEMLEAILPSGGATRSLFELRARKVVFLAEDLGYDITLNQVDDIMEFFDEARALDEVDLLVFDAIQEWAEANGILSKEERTRSRLAKPKAGQC